MKTHGSDRGREWAAASWAFLALVGAAALVLARGGQEWSERRVIYEADSDYNHIIVQEDDDGVRYLLFGDDGGYQSVRKPGEVDRLELQYSKTMMVALAMVNEPASAMIVGLGGASIPTFLHKRLPKMRLDCVEIDPLVIDVARRFFDFTVDATLRAHAADGRRFIEDSKERYDLIFLDAYGNDFIPRHLTTRQFLLAVRKIVKPQGAVLANLWGRGSNPLYDSMVRTYREVFDEVYLFHVPQKANIIVLALPRKEKIAKEDLSRRAAEAGKKVKLPFDLADLVEYGYHDARTLEIHDPILEDPKEAPKEAPKDAAKDSGTREPGAKDSGTKDAPSAKEPVEKGRAGALDGM